jgi:hypothetical protein
MKTQDTTGQQHELKLKLSYRRTSIWGYCECGFDEGYAVADFKDIQNKKQQAHAEHAEFVKVGA